MFFEDIPLYEEFNEVKKCVALKLLAVSDKAEFLGAREYGLKDINDLYGTKYEDIIPAFISQKSENGEHAMRGTLYLFNLTEPLKAHIVEENLECIFGEDESYSGNLVLCTVFLENLTLYSNGKIIFSCTSHEVFSLYHMAEIDDGVSPDVLDEVQKTIRIMPLYQEMSAIAEKLKNKTQKRLEKELRILADLCNYVDEEKKYFFVQIPTYKCSFANFKSIAKEYLTEQTYAVLSPLDSFSQLQPLPVPHKAEDVIKGNNQTLQYIHSDYYRKVHSELAMLKYILDFKPTKAKPIRVKI